MFLNGFNGNSNNNYNKSVQFRKVSIKCMIGFLKNIKIK